MPRETPTTPGRPLSSLSTCLLATAGALVVESAFLLAYETEALLSCNLVMQLVVVIIVASWARSRTGTYLNPAFLFVSAIYFWHSPFMTGYQFGLSALFAYTGNVFTYGEQHRFAATALVGLSLAAAALGAYVAYSQALPARVDSGLAQRRVNPIIAWALYGALLIIALMYLTLEGAPKLQAGYFAQYVDAAPETPLYRLFDATKFFGVLTILLLFESAATRRAQVGATVATSVLIFVHLLFGSRSMPFLYALTLIVCFDHHVRRLSLWLLIAGAIGGAAASFIVDQTRAFGIGLQIFSFRDTGLSVNIFQVFWDAGSVVKTVLRTMEFAAKDGLMHGRTIIDAAISIIPTPVLSAFGITRTIIRPSSWLVEQSSDIPSGGGLGYSLVAEAYLNFGILGFLLFLGIAWYLCRRYRVGTQSPQTLAQLNALNFVILLTLHMRNDIATYLRIILWSMIIVHGVRRFGTLGNVAGKGKALTPHSQELALDHVG